MTHNRSCRQNSQSPSSLFTDATPRRLPERGLKLFGRCVALLAALSVPLSQSAWANGELDVKNGQSNLLVAGSYTQDTAPATTSDVTFLSGTTYSPSIFTISGANTLSIGTLDDEDATQSLTIDNATASTTGTLTLNGGSNAVSPSPSDLLYVATSGTLTITGSNTGSAFLTVTLGAAGNLDIAGTATISAAVTMGANAITMDGGGTLILNAANTGTGGFTIANGTVQINNANSLGSSSNTVTIGNSSSNATLALAGAVAVAQGFTIGGSGTDTITASSNSTPSVGGTVMLNNNLNVNETGVGTLTFGSAALISGNSGITIGPTNTGTVQFSDTSNSFGGTLAIDAGTVAANGSGVLGTATVDLGLNSSYTATLNITSGYTISNALTVEAGTSGSGQRTINNPNTGNNHTGIVSGPITLDDDLTLTAVATTGTGGTDRLQVGSGGITGGYNIIINNSNTATGGVAGSGAIALYGTSSATGWTGNLIIQAGQGALGGSHGANAIGASNTVAVASGAIFNISDGGSISPTIAGLDNATSGGAIGGSTGGQVLNNNTSNETLTLGGNGAYTYAGTITDGATNKTALTVALTGGGSQTLSGANTYTGGTTISAGTLDFANGSLGSTGAITVDGGTLQWASGNTQDISSRLTLVNSGAATLDTQANTVTFASGFGGSTSSSLTKVGSGNLTLNGVTTYTGATNVNGGTLQANVASALGSTTSVAVNTTGTLLLGASSAIKSSATMTLDGGKFSAGGFSQGSSTSGTPTAGLGALTLSANSTINFNTGSGATTHENNVIAFADSHTESWLGILYVDDWDGTIGSADGTNAGSAGTEDALYFGASSSGLTSGQLADIQFQVGGIDYAAGISSSGEVYATNTVVPEPSTVFAALALFGFVSYRERRGIMRSIGSVTKTA